MEANNILIIHHISGSSARVKRLIDSLGKGADKRIWVVASNDTKEELERRGIECKTLSDYITEEDYARLEKESAAFVRSLGSKRFDGDMTLVKLLEYEHTSLWWFVEAFFHWLYMSRVIRYTSTLCSIFDQEKPNKIIVIDDASMLVKTAAVTSKAKNVSIQLLSLGLHQRLKTIIRSLRRKLMPQARFYFREVREFLRRQLWHSPVVGLAIMEKKEIQRKILFASRGTEYVVTDPATGKKRLEDPVLGSVVRELERDEANEIVFLYKSVGWFKLTLPKKAYEGRVLYKPWEYYLTPQIQRAVSAKAKSLTGKWNQLKNTSSFIELWNHKGIDLWEVCRDELERIFLAELPAIVRYIELAKRIMEVERPDIMVVAAETLPSNKALVVAGNLRGIPALAVQHGVIAPVGDAIIDYPCSWEELNGTPSKKLTLPQRFAVYGESVKKVLMKEIGYPFEERLVITGQPQYDVLAKADKVFDRESFCAKWDIDVMKRIVLIASQTFHIAGNRDDFFRGISWALKDDHQMQIVIKPHPVEEAKWHKWYKELMSEMGIKALVLPQKSNTYEALYACDVLITFYSTIALEAMILGKPVVTVNLTSQPDPMPYASKGAALGVYKAEDIAPAVKKALEDKETRERLEQGRQRYLYEQFYKLDGQATKRVVDLIYNMVEERASVK